MSVKSGKKKKKRVNKLVVKVVSIFLIICAIGILYDFGQKVFSIYNLKKQNELVKQELSALQDENASLVVTKNKLEDPNYVTAYARGEYMFSKTDEKVFYLPSSDTTKTSQ